MEDFFVELLVEATQFKAQDIYLLPIEDGYEIKLHDGINISRYKKVSLDIANKLMSYIKYSANMDIAESRRPQLGALIWLRDEYKFPIRVSTVADYNNRETMVVRIIYDQHSVPQNWLDDNQFEDIIRQLPANGLVLVVGPTGSGKTSTIHQIISTRQDTDLILTIEDPVEIKNNKVVQLQVNEKAEMGYTELIKVSLRHHPDMLVIGEVRDSKTAQATVQAALSGHLVLATIHANSAKEAISRFVDLGLNENLVKQILRLSIYQALIPTTKNTLAALVDIQNKADLHDLSFGFKSDWKNVLQKSLEKKQITNENFQKFSKIAS